MIYATLLSFVLVLLSMKPAFANFKNGNELVTAPIEGTATVRCDGFNGRQTAVYQCRDLVMDPGPYDYFMGPVVTNGTAVNLKAFHQDGSSRSKSEKYLGSRGISVETFNLWISTIFQRPLLEYGANRVMWQVVDDSERVLAEGQFVANVKRGPARQCEPAFYNSTDANDCNSQFTVCQRYFEQNNFCNK